MHFLQCGALWHLLGFLFDYDYTLEESGVASDEESNQQKKLNKISKLAFITAGRLAGRFGRTKDEESELYKTTVQHFGSSIFNPTEYNPVIENCLQSMLTGYIGEMKYGC